MTERLAFTPVALRSRRQIAPFTLYRPATIGQALALHAEPGTNAYLAGGIDLIDRLKYGHPVDRVIRLDAIPGLADIVALPDGLRIGATATHAAIASSGVIRTLLPSLADLWPLVANPRVRFTGTIGGNVMAGNADYDGLPALLALGAQTRAMDSLVTSFDIPHPTTQRLFTNRSLRPALIIWLGLTISNNHGTALRIGIGMAYPAATGITIPLDLPLSAIGSQAATIAQDVVSRLPEPISDGKASASYRRRMIGVLTRRMLIRAAGPA